VTKCNKNQSKGENKAPTIINTGKYTKNQFVSITYQSINHFRNILMKGLLHTHLIQYSFTHKIVPFKQMLTVDMLINNLSFFIDPNVKIIIKNQSKGENKAPTIINTGKYTKKQFVSITYQSINHFRNILIKGLLVKSVIGVVHVFAIKLRITCVART
jgi:protein tyrosine/serine phosphatase